MRGIVLFATFISFQSIIFSAVIKVPGDYPTIQQAIDVAVAGDTVLVAPGTYVENIDFKGKAITVRGDSGPDVTVIDGNQAGSVITCQSGEDENSVLDGFMIVNGSGTSTPPYGYTYGGGMYNEDANPTVINCIFSGNTVKISGMYNEDASPTVINCILSGNTVKNHGGGMYTIGGSPEVTNCTFSENTSDIGGGMYNCDHSSLTVTNCTFSGNTVFDCGAGMFNKNNSNPMVTNCIFKENWAICHSGGGMANSGVSNPMVINCIFSGNEACFGGGMYNCYSSPTVIHCIFNGNWVDYIGGGMHNWNSSPTVTNCTFSENAGDEGGGMSNQSSSPTVTNCTFNGNLVDYHGGGMVNFTSNPIVIHCTLSENVAIWGGGLYNENSSPTVTNCTFTGNVSANCGGGMFSFYYSDPTVSNTVLWNNEAPEGPEIWLGGKGYPSTLTVSYSNVEGGQSSVQIEAGSTLIWGSGMINAAPLFVNSASGDFHLTFNSPCRGSGDNTAVTELYDFEGDPRIAFGTVDMGADEFYTHLYWTGDAVPGGSVEVKFVGLPGTSPVGLCIGTGVLDPPIKSMWGDWYLQFPILGPIDLVKIPSPEGVLVIPATIPGSPPAPYSIPMQALIGAELTNLSVLEVK